MTPSTSTRNQFWEMECRKLAEKGATFRVMHVETNTHKIHCSAIAFQYKYLIQFEDQTTVLMAPNEQTTESHRTGSRPNSSSNGPRSRLCGGVLGPITRKARYQ